MGLVDAPKKAEPYELKPDGDPGSWQAALFDDGKSTIASQLVERLREEAGGAVRRATRS